MGKKCTLCGSAARYSVKDSSEYYCDECAIDNFSDVGVLQPLEEETKKVQRMVEESIEDDKKFEPNE